jgi:hypothetical protein
MSSQASSQVLTAELSEVSSSSHGEEPLEATDAPIERLFEHVPENLAERGPPALRTARVVSMQGEAAKICYRGGSAELLAEIDGDVDKEVITRAMVNGDRVLVEVDPGLGATIVGVIQTRVPADVEIKGQRVVIEADEEVLVRAGHAALRFRQDGDIELVGGRISAMSRGLLKLVGRMIRIS